ncbi:MAG: SusC/RagA family TonB-linked outer membrane protein [Phaeodactylibacter sp.]|nr:SusC/RagA family TonB-linked outer membrane protein [Phaeodactylibacter sp.]MCB9273070.1 SusC/RagA family TonB-linked outer membrane protein [Lewinellaceae bacterium]
MGKHLPVILRYPLLALALFYCLSGSAQEISVKGTAVGADSGNPLAGVAVEEKGTANRVLTDETGHYEIRVRQSFFTDLRQPVLVFSYAGYEALEEPLNGRSLLDVQLEPEARQAAGLFVTGRAVGCSPEVASYAASQVDEALFQAAPAPTITGGLQGKVAGLRATPTGGQPGESAFLQLRAANAIANGQQPLLLVDGIYLNGSTLADINPEDIERIEVLKGAAGAAFYGSQGANGVIQIFTRNGKGLEAGDTRFTYRTELGYSRVADRYALNEFTNREVVDAKGPQPVLGAVTADAVYDTPLPNLQDYQEDILFRDGAFRSHYLSVQSNTGPTHFLASAQRFKDEGVIQGVDGYERNTFRANLGHQAGRLGIRLNAMYSGSSQSLVEPTANGPGSLLSNSLLLTPIFGLGATNEEDDAPHDWDIDNTGQEITNPLYLRDNSQQSAQRSRLMGSFGATFRLTPWLSFDYAASLDRSTNTYEHYLHKGYLSTSVPGMFGPLATAGVDGSNGGGIQRSRRLNNYFTSAFDAVVQRSFLGLNTAARAGFLYEGHSQEFDATMGEDLAVDGIRSLDNARRNLSISSEVQEVVAYSGYLAADADYKKKYLFSGAVRQEESSLFGQDEGWNTYYRLSGAYRLTEDIRLKPFQELKLRAAYGRAGIRPAYEQRFETYELISGVATKKTLGNEHLQPAVATELEVGADAVFLRAFTLDFSYVQSTTDNQILLIPLSGAAGFEGQWRNAGAVEAVIYEAGLDIDFAKLFKIGNTDFHWNLFTTFSKMDQTVSRLDIPEYTTGPGLTHSSIFRIEEGGKLGAMAGEVFATSVEQLAEQGDIDPRDYDINSLGYIVSKAQMGTPDERPYKLTDENGNPLIQVIGDINPDFRMGFAHTIGFKGLDLYILADWKKGGDVYNLSKQWLYNYERHVDLSNYPDVAGGFFGAGGLADGMAPNSHFVEDGSFFILREAALSYTLRNKLFGGAVEHLRFSLIGRNLFTKTHYSGYNPDISAAPRGENTLSNRYAGGRGSDARTPYGDPSLFLVDAFSYPQPKTLTFSIQITF